MVADFSIVLYYRCATIDLIRLNVNERHDLVSELGDPFLVSGIWNLRDLRLDKSGELYWEVMY